MKWRAKAKFTAKDCDVPVSKNAFRDTRKYHFKVHLNAFFHRMRSGGLLKQWWILDAEVAER